MLLELDDVTKRFGGLVASDSVSFNVNKGEIVGLIGPNGAGKSTIFNVICGIYKPEKGRILFKEEDITGKLPHEICKLGIGRTFQIVKPFSSMTVAQNVGVASFFGLGLRGKRIDEGVKELLEFTGLWQKRDHNIDHLTLEDKKRLEICRALAVGPTLLLLDEAMAGLTSVEVKAGMDLIRKVRERGITVLMIEHVMQAVMGVCERIVVLSYGKKIAEGSPEEVRTHARVLDAYLGTEEVV